MKFYLVEENRPPEHLIKLRISEPEKLLCTLEKELSEYNKYDWKITIIGPQGRKLMERCVCILTGLALEEMVNLIDKLKETL